MAGMTLHPRPDFWSAAMALHEKHLQHAVQSAKQIIEILKDDYTDADPDNEPWVLMWEHRVTCLGYYGHVVGRELRSRGGNVDQSTFDFFSATITAGTMPFSTPFGDPTAVYPDEPRWIGNDYLHCAHRAYLIGLMPEYYRQHWPMETTAVELVYPKP